ncbi:AraC family transcriptional regulator [Brevibacillus laterosporus]|uniref:AraC family transcriptional regulator n=1 Tax=Brevibacillus laterosporus TaxID=1465 RepID=A0AAP8QBL6_BRELA|nr:AraC family transcriptional regulator [Brevibacillus laterosporus]MCR8980830.1 AraC family transcriptional regulator [Brevibacillus laterosporus]MCZ0807985.1 AraC family transcriptional regulator [Brevibacillus laterosporus]MCZ0826453.1 AraC family transcriptional regulator [Brevibacillus laterosporus]MCZ0850930.1 AraC family transcriptional regulator [Brevibacillus laterosporus]MED1664870.1 AraC family transcriptional regulator [Brevibacillus laterosporus]
MIDVDKLAEIFASGSYDIEGVYRLVIQPKSILREFRTVRDGFLFTIRGEARMCVNGTAYELHPGSVFHAAPGMQLESQVIGQSEYEYYLLFYRFDKLGDENSGHVCDSHFKLEPGANPRVIELLIMIHQNAHTLGGIGKLRVKELFLSIMHQVLVGCRHRESGSSPSKKVIEEAITYINGHYMNPLTLDELAELHAMSPKRFSYFFHKYTGFRPIDYVINYRMERASELLKTGNYPICDIAVSVGYANPLYFSRVFKKKFGVSPSAYTQKLDNPIY